MKDIHMGRKTTGLEILEWLILL